MSAEARSETRPGSIPALAPHHWAFSIVDDTDGATLENVKPVYDLLASLGLRATKTVWSLRHSGPEYASSATLEDGSYAEWLRHLQSEGFEVAFHGASAMSNTRARTLRGLEAFEAALGRLPVMHINHRDNEDNLYWGPGRFDNRFVRLAVRCLARRPFARYSGHVPGSPFFWGDVACHTVRYCRNLCFQGSVDLSELNAHLPYRDPRRELVPSWFSALDAGEPARFVRLFTPARLARLFEQGGVCIAYVHFGMRFTRRGKVLPEVERIFREIASAPGGLFLPASELLDRLAGEPRGHRVLTRAERSRMEFRWLTGKLLAGGTS